MGRGKLLEKMYNLGLDIVRLKVNDKRPAEKWKTSKNRSLDSLQGWSGNFGAALGERSNGIVVVDLDQAELYKYFSDVKTLIVKTPNKGYHIYIKSKKKQDKIPTYLFKPIDLQANGSYVVIPPSSINDKYYEIIKDEPILEVDDPEEFIKGRLTEIIFKKSVDCRGVIDEFYAPNNSVEDHGHYYLINCPFHKDDTPSMAVYEDGIKCFGCGWYGDAEAFLSKYKNMDYEEIVDYLGLHGMELDESDLKLQTKRQKELLRLVSIIKSKYSMVTDVLTSRPYIYYKKMNSWKDIKEEAFFFRELIAEETGFIPLDDDMKVLYQYVRNPVREDSDWVNFKNGSVNSETGEFKKPSDEIFTQTWINFNYRSDANGEYIERVLREILCDEKDGDSKYTFFLEMVGYLFTGGNTHNRMFFLTGTGANGKSTLMHLITEIFKGYTCAVQLQDLSRNFGLQPLLGKKVNIVYDLSAKALTDIGSIKAITGGDEISIDRKFESTISVRLGTKILATGNILPKVDEATFAFFRRVVHLELKNRFTNPDRGIYNKISADIEGIEWLIYNSIKAYQKVSENGWTINEDISTVQDTYHRVSDPLNWICEKIFENGNEDDFLTREQVYIAMKQELEENEMGVPRNRKVFYDSIRTFGGVDERRTVNGKQLRVFTNIKPKFVVDGMMDMVGWNDQG
jgi:putative DNA primase/helicase